MWKKTKLRIGRIFIVFILLITIFMPTVFSNSQEKRVELSNIPDPITDINCVIISDADPYFGIIGSSIACRYQQDNMDILLPMIIAEKQIITKKQHHFLTSYTARPYPIILGNTIEQLPYKNISIAGNAPKVSLRIATQMYSNATEALILPYSTGKNYQLSLIASPLASYLNIPILLYDDNLAKINTILLNLSISKLYIVGDMKVNWSVKNQIFFQSAQQIHDFQLDTIKRKFKKINYITMTNPSDVKPKNIIETKKIFENKKISHSSITLFGKSLTINGNDTITQTMTVPKGIIHLNVKAVLSNDKSIFNSIKSINPLISIKIFNSSNKLIAYASSPACEINKVFSETLICNAPGRYMIQIKLYHGVKGGFFSQRGFSFADAEINITTSMNQMKTSHYPLVPKLSMLAPYLTSYHGGIILAEESFGLTTDDYEKYARGKSTGPWYDESLHKYNNKKAMDVIDHIESLFHTMDEKELLDSYVQGPAWLGILADTNMIPMYYFGPSQSGILEKGLPSDNLYSFNHSLSPGRILSHSVSDVSFLLCRTFFYETICRSAISTDSWYNSFHFIFGEGFGETGGLFHQIPYAKQITQYGFEPVIFGDLRNSRQAALALGTYSDANYIEYLGHGDWFWFTPSLYGFDIHSKAIDVAHVNDWCFDRPNVFLTSACLMGRVDGISASTNIGLAFLSAGSNSFIVSTRLTGQESGLEILENSLIIDNLSIGEALREEKRKDKEMPTYVVRTLYGDPAFNPYEPNNGFSDQGRPYE